MLEGIACLGIASLSAKHYIEGDHRLNIAAMREEIGISLAIMLCLPICLFQGKITWLDSVILFTFLALYIYWKKRNEEAPFKEQPKINKIKKPIIKYVLIVTTFL